MQTWKALLNLSEAGRADKELTHARASFKEQAKQLNNARQEATTAEHQLQQQNSELNGTLAKLEAASAQSREVHEQLEAERKRDRREEADLNRLRAESKAEEAASKAKDDETAALRARLRQEDDELKTWHALLNLSHAGHTEKALDNTRAELRSTEKALNESHHKFIILEKALNVSESQSIRERKEVQHEASLYANAHKALDHARAELRSKENALNESYHTSISLEKALNASQHQSMVERKEIQQESLQFEEARSKLNASLVSLKDTQDNLSHARQTAMSLEHELRSKERSLNESRHQTRVFEKEAQHNTALAGETRAALQKTNASLRESQQEVVAKAEEIQTLRAKMANESKDVEAWKGLLNLSQAGRDLKATREKWRKASEKLAKAYVDIKDKDKELRQDDTLLNASRTEIAADTQALQTVKAQLNETTIALNANRTANAQIQKTNKHLRDELQGTRTKLQARTEHLAEEIRELNQSAANLTRAQQELETLHSLGNASAQGSSSKQLKVLRTQIGVEKEVANEQTNQTQWALVALTICIAVAGLLLCGVLRSRRSYADQVQHHLNMIVQLNSERKRCYAKFETLTLSAQTGVFNTPLLKDGNGVH